MIADEPAWPRARVMSWIYGGGGVLAIALLLRYALIEPHGIGIACAAEQVPWWCVARQGIVWFHIAWVWGALGLIGGFSSATLEWSRLPRLGVLVLVLGVLLSYSVYPNIGIHAVWVWALLCVVAAIIVFKADTLWTVRFGLAMSILALVLYNSDYGAIGLALTLLRLPRV